MIFQYQNINWRDRPNQWGNFDYVQGNMFDRAAKIGIDPEKTELAMFMWNKGDQRDYSKNELVGVNTGASYIKNSLKFDDGDLLRVSSYPKINSSFTYLTEFISTESDIDSHFLCDNSISTDGGFQIFLNTDNTIRMRIDDSGANYCLIDTTDTISSNINSTVVGIGDKTGYAELFLDGIQNGNKVDITSFGDISGTDTNFSIGCRETGAATPEQCWNGFILQSLWFSQVLNSDQIAFLSDNPYYLFQPYSPVFYSFPEIIAISNLSRYHNLNGLGGQGAMTWNPLG